MRSQRDAPGSHGRRIQMTVTCDDCVPSSGIVVEAFSYAEALVKVRRAGWVRRKLVDGYADLCPGCDSKRCSDTGAAKGRK